MHAISNNIILLNNKLQTSNDNSSNDENCIKKTENCVAQRNSKSAQLVNEDKFKYIDTDEVHDSNAAKNCIQALDQLSDEYEDFLYENDLENETKDYLQVVDEDSDAYYLQLTDNEKNDCQVKDYLQVVGEGDNTYYLQLTDNENDDSQATGVQPTKNCSLGVVNVVYNVI